MKAQVKQNMKNYSFQGVVNNTNKNQWIQMYAERMLKVWKTWQGALGVADAYIEQIKEELSAFYDDPLEKTFIENTY